MKKSLLVFCSFALVISIAVFAYNSDKGPARETDGISVLAKRVPDSLLRRGRDLLSPMHYSEQDLKAIAAYVNNR